MTAAVILLVMDKRLDDGNINRGDFAPQRAAGHEAEWIWMKSSPML
ncbi:MAG TPA: hypothetical protein VEH06_10240 [Candidatus Bathyarchaeia archaeon]|nr:hypothetical protein [Candidatus Bathyarchaeia archaeon]